MPAFPLLKKITSRRDYGNGREGLKFCPSFIEELMTAAPNIFDISVSDPLVDREENEDEDNGRNINVVLNCIEKLGREAAIQSLFLKNARINDIEHIEKMAKNGLKLKSLTLYPAGNIAAVERHTVQIKLATCFKESLEYLIVEKTVDNILMEFPKMPKLKSLTQQIKLKFEIIPLNLNEKFPVLETLCIEFRENEWAEFFSEFDPCLTIKSFTVLNVYMKMYTFHDVLIIFPNLTKLNLQIGPHDGVEVLKHIWSQMTGLESLIISGYMGHMQNDYLDSLFTGISTQALKSIRHVVNDLDHLSVEDRTATILNLGRDHRRLPSVQNLTKLRHLVLHITGDFILTDFTAYLAFYSMNHLQSSVNSQGLAVKY